MKRIVIKSIILFFVSLILVALGSAIFTISNYYSNSKSIDDLLFLVLVIFPIVAGLIGIIGNLLVRVFWIPPIISVIIFGCIDIFVRPIRGGSIIFVVVTFLCSVITEAIVNSKST